jgi:D-inositol-3-phosphate glycosyltransferase
MFHTLGAIKNAIGVGDAEPALRIMAERELAQDCQRIIAATDREKHDLGRYYDAPPDKISVIPCGVNLDLFRRIDKETARQRLGFNGNKIILFVGRIEPLKGLDKLLTALSALGSGQARLVGMLVMVGGDERSQAEVERLRKLSHRLHIEDIVTFRGIEEQERLPLYYSAADVCVIPSYYESFGLVALESLACGTPIVATRVGCIESVIRQGQNGCMVADNAPARLADGIAALLTEQDNGSKSADSIRASIEEYSWSNIAEVMVPVYKEAISGQHSAIRRAH